MSIWLPGNKEVTDLYANVNGQKKQIVSAWVNKNGVTTQVYGAGGAAESFLPKGYCMIIRDTIYISGSGRKGEMYATNDMVNFYRITNKAINSLVTFYEQSAQNKKYYVNYSSGSQYVDAVTNDFINFTSTSVVGDYSTVYNDETKKTFTTKGYDVYLLNNVGNFSAINESVRGFENLGNWNNSKYIWIAPYAYNSLSASKTSLSGSASGQYGTTYLARLKNKKDVAVVFSYTSRPYTYTVKIYLCDDLSLTFSLDEENKIYEYVSTDDTIYRNLVGNLCVNESRKKLYFIRAFKDSAVVKITEIGFDGSYQLYNINLTNVLPYASGASCFIDSISYSSVCGKGLVCAIKEFNNKLTKVYYIANIQDFIELKINKWSLLASYTSDYVNAWDTVIDLMPIREDSYANLIVGKQKV